MILYRKDDFVYFDYNNQKAWIHTQKVDFAVLGPTTIRVNAKLNTSSKLVFEGECSDILNYEGDPYGTTPEQVILGFNKGFDTQWQDQHSDAIVVKFNQVVNSTTLTAQPAVGDYTIAVTSPTGIVTGSYIILFDPVSVRFSTFYCVSIAASVVTLDTPIDFAYPIGTYVDVAITDLAVNGAVTPQEFGLRGTGAPPGIDLKFDMTRIIFKCKTTTPVALNLFGDLTRLTRGLVMRVLNGRYHNVFNVKSNGDLAALMYDWTPYLATNPAQGQDGFVSRLTFSGTDKIGVTIRLPVGDDAQFIVQDDLSGLDSLEVTAEGHIVEDTP